ncbi:hypothetical protein [Kordia jejudonensis]|uniref:hypothetical protein n=1 Tax=Kordia jejudonensis TaxID=1348245 RepID=UPI000629CA36|nr:hypothetical protein [Kordia jejudonensis]
MSTIDQNNAMLSLEKALVPKSNLIDGRSEKDQLRMLVDFAALFNFYEQDNSIHGNWSPFLLKDPVFLVASIAKSTFQKTYTLFINTCIQVQLLLAKIAKGDDVEESVLSTTYNQLFEQLTNIFQTIQDWTVYMKNSTYTYNLKTYVINNVKKTYSLLLWSLLEFQEALSKQTIIPLLQPVNTTVFETYDQKIWKTSKGEMPYWTVLGLPTFPCEDDATQNCFYISKITPTAVFDALQYTGKKIFSFFSNCVSYADTELETIKKVPGHFPDTLLLRTFTSLLKIYQAQLNGLTTKHLNFYYQDILLQKPKNTVADTVFVCCELTKTTDTYRLQKNTTFAAGVDANKQPILFQTTNATSLNPAKIVNAYTLTAGATNAANTQLYLDKLPPVNVITKDESGVVQQWNTFGSQQTPKGTIKDMGIAFASPMLHLTEAKTRTITITMSLSNDSYSAIIQNDTNFYLSTAATWFQILTPKRTINIKNNAVTITITLDATDPAITAFIENPDGYSSDWPLFKMSFSAYETKTIPPAISSLTISVDVIALQNFQLYNDFGAIDATKPFQPLGPAPNVNQNFMVGSNEVFSKPVTDISLTLTWNPFPAGFDFSTYYEEYNDYFNGKYTKVIVNNPEEKELFKDFMKTVNSLFQKILNNQKAMYNSILKSAIDVIKKLIDDEIATLKALIKTDVNALEQKINSDHAIMQYLKNAVNALLHDLEKIAADSIKDITANGIVDTTKVTNAKNTATTKITNTKNTIVQKVGAFQTTALAQLPKTSIFKKIGGAIGGLFKKDVMSSLIFQYSNSTFFVDFTWLQNGVWEGFSMKRKDDEISSTATENLFFPLDDTNTIIPATRTFDFSGIEVASTQIDPTLQHTPLLLTDTTSLGFLKMQFVSPSYGFGLDIYPKVVGAIALYNGRLMIKHPKKPLVNPPSIPFTPMVSKITGNYSASTTYDFSKSNNAYPLECFYYTPFQNYKVYDTTNGISAKDTTIGNLPTRDSDGNCVPLTALPLVPNFTATGQLFLELSNVIAPAQISFYFELARTYTEQTFDEKTVTFSYLSTTGWKALSIISDSTNEFTCAGIITVNVPSDIATTHENMPGNNCWIAIGTTNTPDSFAKTTFLKTNGITLKRSITASDVSKTAPQLIANVISSPEKAIPEISATVQPFPSFGGKAAETNQQMNSRVSKRLKTKDRLVTSEDYFNMIRLEFPEVYYSKTNHDATKKKVMTYLVKRVSDATVANAFEPLISECSELAIETYIQNRVNAFTNIAVSNFELKYVKIKATITVDANYEITSVSKEINDGINIFLSPWITSAQEQITIDKGLNTAQIASFINSFDAVIELKDISFQIGSKDFTTGTIRYDEDPTPKYEFTPKNNALIVPSLNNLTKKSSITYAYHI